MKFRGTANDGLEFIGFPRLVHIPVDMPIIDGLDRRFRVREAGQDDADRLWIAVVNLAQEFDPGHPRHALVRDHNRDRLVLRHDLERLGGIGSRQNLVEIHERKGHRFKDGLLVIDDQDSRSFRFAPSAL